MKMTAPIFVLTTCGQRGKSRGVDAKFNWASTLRQARREIG